MSQPPFSRIGICGLGLIGGSVALSVRRVWADVTLIGFDHSRAAVDAARSAVVHETVGDIAGLATSDLIVLAAPLEALTEVMLAVAQLGERAVVTDVGSTKRKVMAAASAAGLAAFVGGHPMAGSEHGGLAHARDDMFVGRPWLLVPGTGDAAAGARVEAFVAGLGARPQWIDAETHDRAVAYVSHLPQLLAVALMNAAHDAVGDAGLATAGRAFAEMTRLAASPPEMWRSILESNADFVAEAAGRFLANLPAGSDLSGEPWVREAFTRAGAVRARLGPGETPKR